MCFNFSDVKVLGSLTSLWNLDFFSLNILKCTEDTLSAAGINDTCADQADIDHVFDIGTLHIIIAQLQFDEEEFKQIPMKFVSHLYSFEIIENVTQGVQFEVNMNKITLKDHWLYEYVGLRQL